MDAFFEDSGSDYVPESDQDESSSEDNTAPVTKICQSPIQSNIQESNSSEDLIPILEEEQQHIETNKNDDEEENLIVVSQTTNTKHKRNWDKRQACYFCKKMVTKLPRHFIQVHPNEKDVIEFSRLPPNNEARKAILNNLRSAGNYIHNTETIERNKGTIIPKRRQIEPSSPSKLVPCTWCNQFINKGTLYRHKKKCTGNKRNVTQSPGRRQSAVRIATYLLSNVTRADFQRYANLFQRRIVNGMKDDLIKSEIEKDSLIMKFGIEQLEKFEHQPSQINVIRNRLRELGRLMIEVKKIKQIVGLIELLKVDHYELLVSATKAFAGFDPETNTFKTPSNATRIGETIKKCVAICKREALMEKNIERKVEIEDYLSLLETDWPSRISTKAHTTLHTAKFNQGNQLPDPDDMRKLNAHITDERKAAMDDLKKKPNAKNYSRLSRITLATITIFNRKRAGDSHHLLLKNYLKGSRGNESKDILNSLNDEEKELVNSFTRLETRGKKGRKIPILLTPQIKIMTDLLVENRKKCGMLQENDYFFGIPGTTESYFRTSDIIRRLRREAKVIHEDRITTTAMRKEAATLSAACGLSEQQVDLLANFLGHTNLVHRTHYRLPEATLEKAKVGKFLTTISNAQHDTQEPLELSFRDATLVENAVTSEVQENDYTRNERVKSKKKRMWREDEENLIQNIKRLRRWTKPPGKKECLEVIKSNPMFRSRDWLDIKYKVKNIIHSENNTRH